MILRVTSSASEWLLQDWQVRSNRTEAHEVEME